MDEILKNEEKVVLSLRKLYTQFGYRLFKMSRFEEYDLYVRNKDFLLSDQIITFSDRSGRLLALKPDVTLSIIKNVQDVPGSINRYYYNENVYRVDKGTQSFKEIMQTGLECVGDISVYETAEVVLLAARSLAEMGLPFILDLSHMGFLNAILEDEALRGADRGRVMTLLHQKNSHEMRKLCICAGCDSAATELLCQLCSLSGGYMEILPILSGMVFSQMQRKPLDELTQICSVLEQQGFGGNIHIDFSAGSRMQYYSGIVFCGYLQGIPDVVLSGGQYDALLEKMKKHGRAIGFAIYLDMLQRIQGKKAYDVDTILLYSNKDSICKVMEIADSLRQDGSVQVVSSVTDSTTYRKLMKIENGEAVLIEEHD